MTPIEMTTTTMEMPRDDFVIDDAQLTAEQYDHQHAALAVLLGLNGLGSAKHAPRTSNTLGLNGVVGPCGSWARAPNRRSRWWPCSRR
jgi:hypothetical protein